MTAPAQRPLFDESERCQRCGRPRQAGTSSALDLARLALLSPEEFWDEVHHWTGRCSGESDVRR